MSQFKNLYDTNNKLNALPLAQRSGSQQQTDYNNSLTVYNNYLNSLNPQYSTTWGGSPAKVSNSGIYQILQFNTSQTFTITTTAPKRIYYVLVGGGGSGGCAVNSAWTVYGAGGGGGGNITSGSFIQPANTTVQYYTTVGAGGIAAGISSLGATGGNTVVTNSLNANTLTANGGGYGYGNGTSPSTSLDNLNLNVADGVNQNTNAVKYIYLNASISETVSTFNQSYRFGGNYSNNIYDLPDGYTLQVGPSYVIRLGGGGGAGSTTVPSTIVINNSLWGGGSGGWSVSYGAQSGLPNTGGGGGGEIPYQGTYTSNSATGGSGTVIFFYENDTVNTNNLNTTQISNPVEIISTSQGNYKSSLLNSFVFNPTNNLGLLNVTLKSTINTIVATNSISTYMKNKLIKQSVYSSYLPNGSPNLLIIDYTLNPLYATNYKATGHNFYFNTYTAGTYSIYYGNLNIINLPTATNRIYTFNFYAISRYNNHNTIINYPTINVNTIDIPLNGVSNITFPTTNTYNTKKIVVISSPTLPLTFFAYTTVQSINISDIAYIPPFAGVVTFTFTGVTSSSFTINWVGSAPSPTFAINSNVINPNSSTSQSATFTSLGGSYWTVLMIVGAVVATSSIINFGTNTITMVGYSRTNYNYLQIKWRGGNGASLVYSSQNKTSYIIYLNGVVTVPTTLSFDGTNIVATFFTATNINIDVNIFDPISDNGYLFVPSAPSSLSQGGTTYLYSSTTNTNGNTGQQLSFGSNYSINSGFNRLYYRFNAGCRFGNSGYYSICNLKADIGWQTEIAQSNGYVRENSVGFVFDQTNYIGDGNNHQIAMIYTNSAVSCQVDSGPIQTTNYPTTLYHGTNYNMNAFYVGANFGWNGVTPFTNLLVTN